MKKFWGLCVAVALVATMVATMTGVAFATQTNQLVKVDLWNANVDQPSMGNIATDYNPQALYNPATGTLQVALNPVSVSGYQSGLGGMRYDASGRGDYVDVATLSTTTVHIGTKYDGIDRQITVLTCVEIQLPEYLTGRGVEYLSLEMQVPYTPMDTVIGDGYLASRLRIDWSSAVSTDLTALQPNVTMSAGQTAPLLLESKGFLVNSDTNTLSEVTRLSVEEVTGGADYALASTALAGEDFALYRINLTVGGAETSPTGAIFLTFPYENLDGLYRINTSGSKTALYGTQEKDGYEIMTRSIGLFAVVGGELLDIAPAVPAAPQIEESQTPNQERETGLEQSTEPSQDHTEMDAQENIQEVATSAPQNQSPFAVYVNSSYWNPDTGEIDDGGTANAALGDGMSRSVTGTTALVEEEGDAHYVTLRLLLQSSAHDVQFWTRTGYNSYEAISYEVVAEYAQTDSVDYRFALSDPFQPIKASMYVVPMGRETVWYIQLDENTVFEAGEFTANGLTQLESQEAGGGLTADLVADGLADGQLSASTQQETTAEAQVSGDALTGEKTLSHYLRGEIGAMVVVLITAIAIALGVMWMRGKKA